MSEKRGETGSLARLCSGLLLIAGVGAAFCCACAEDNGKSAGLAEISRFIEGGEEVLAGSFTGKVVAIDQDKREVTLELGKGNMKKITATEAAYNFDQIKINDTVKVDMQRYLQVFIGKMPDEHGAEPPSFIDRAPKGNKPEGVAITYKDVTSTVKNINRKKRSLTLRTQEGKTMDISVPAGAVTDLNQIKKGDTVVLRHTTATALKVESPNP